MRKPRTLKMKMLLRMSLKKDVVFTRDDFKDLGGYDQIGRALLRLTKEKKLIKIGYGLYAKAKISPINGQLVPKLPLPSLAREALSKLKVETYSAEASKDYNSGKSTQVPTGRVIAVKDRVVRKIGYNGIFINYERTTR